MSKPEQVKLTLNQKKVLDVLEGGVRTWEELRALIKISDDHLGLRLGELLNMRKIWTGQRNNVRVYGIERRTGLMPRLIHELRRESDFHERHETIHT